ncbi:MAG TPA: hypothetical protein VHX39_06335 [Acetobacteraceae bacterium]|nr:hypothetical protein [Acetobacteraceae bacterium]
MAAGFTFVATSAKSAYSLYEADYQADTYWSGYLLPPQTGAPPESISYTDSLRSVLNKGSYTAAYAGSFLFAPTRPPDTANFIDGVVSYLQSQKLIAGSQTVLWIPTVDPLSFGQPFAAYCIVFTCNGQNGRFIASGNWNAQIGQNFTFNILLNATLQIAPSGDRIQFSVPPLSQGISFARGHTNLGIVVTGDATGLSAYLPFTGNSAGCCLFAATIQPAVTFAAGGLPFGFFYSALDTSGGGTQTDNFYYPAFSIADLPASLACIGTVDVLDPFNQAMPATVLQAGGLRTGFVLPGGAALQSCLRNVPGNQIGLLPLGGVAVVPAEIPRQAGALALTTGATVPGNPASAVPALTLTGQFAVSAAQQAAGATVQLLCGLYGSEFISLTSYDPSAGGNDALLFYLASPAFAPVFPFVVATLNAPSSGNVVTPLTPAASTAWVTVVQGAATAPTYHAEPAGSPQFGFPADIGGAAIVLQSRPPALPVPQGVAHAFPMVPYAGISATTPPGPTLASFESSILAATRKQIISGGAQQTWAARSSALTLSRARRRAAEPGVAADPPPGTAYVSTPQGLIATVDTASGAYLSVALGQTVSDAGTALPFVFNHPTIALQDALQTNQLFLVVVNPANLVDVPADFENAVEIAGWSMAAEVGVGVSATQYANVMILKYCSGSFKDRIANPNQWTAQADFSLPAGTDPNSDLAGVSYTGLSSWLQGVVKTAEIAVAANPGSPYANFVNLVNDPAWNGVLVLQASLDANSLPAGLAGIVAGIDLTRFVAHHFGFTASRVSVNASNTITFNGNSSTFGLVDYINPTFAANLAMGLPPDTPITLPIADNYAFSVLQLQVLFDNAAIKSFVSYIELGADALFQTLVLSTTFNGTRMPSNGVVLDGSYIDQNGTGIYIFVQALPTVFALDSNVLRAVAFNRVQFNSLGTIDDGATMLNRFLVWGHFDFTALTDGLDQPLDILSFGDPNAVPGQTPSGSGLSFSNLLIDMTYPRTTPNAVTFVENTQNLSYDLPDSQSRDGSLFKGFALQLSGFIAATGNERPADYGYLTVGTSINATSLGNPWYGVTYNVTMGGPGALASAAGFNSSLLLAWSPASAADDKQYAVFTGLSLPGAAPGAKLLSLQGVFKVSVDSITLSLQTVPDEAATYYCLRLANIGLKILGIKKLPSDSSINFFLFGDPGGTGSLGWYAAYNATAPQAALPPPGP